LIVGPPSGQIAQLITKVTAIQNKHGKFEAMFINGDLFAPGNSQKEGQEAVEEEQEGEEKNLLDGQLKRECPGCWQSKWNDCQSWMKEKVPATKSTWRSR